MEAEDKQTVETPEQSVQQPDVNADATGQAVETETVAPPQADGTAVEEKPYKGFAGKLDKFFGIRKAKTTFRAEIVGGVAEERCLAPIRAFFAARRKPKSNR